MKRPSLVAALAFGVVFVVAPARAQAPAADTVLLNGKIITLDARSWVAEAIAIRDGKILAVGSVPEVLARADSHTTRIALDGRTVVPGLMDLHIHALRAGLTFATEVSWIGAPTLADGLARIAAAARTAPPGAWIKVGGGWTELQFPERRGPTVADSWRRHLTGQSMCSGSTTPPGSRPPA